MTDTCKVLDSPPQRCRFFSPRSSPRKNNLGICCRRFGFFCSWFFQTKFNETPTWLVGGGWKVCLVSAFLPIKLWGEPIFPQKPKIKYVIPNMEILVLEIFNFLSWPHHNHTHIQRLTITWKLFVAQDAYPRLPKAGNACVLDWLPPNSAGGRVPNPLSTNILFRPIKGSMLEAYRPEARPLIPSFLSSVFII